MDQCKRCGTCCQKGGPALHKDDKELVEQGYIPLKSLFTIRKGESALDNVRGRVYTVSEDVIRIKGSGGLAGCLFYDGAENGCTVYLNRPIECRALKCWDTRDIEKIYSVERLSRKELLEASENFSELVNYHEGKCDVEKIREWISRLDNGENREALENIREIIAIDEHIRSLAQEKAICEIDILDFLLGRPVREILPGLGLKVARKNGVYRFSPVPAKYRP